MINISDKSTCCGCAACEQICVHKSITMQEDNEGFLYPHVDKTTCVDCGLCNKVCPVLNRYEVPVKKPLSYACKSHDDSIVDKSSSGGLFTVLGENIIRKGGVVFGARFDSNWNVVYDYTESIEGLASFRGSKYVQGVVGDAFSHTKHFLQQGRLVLFTGTPCHISGLNHYLKKNYENLITIDFVCHSIPSPKVWRDYLHNVGKGQTIGYVTFRDKSFGWDNYGLRIENDKHEVLDKGGHKDNLYMKAFSSNLIVRPSCFNCPARNYTSGSDIMIADCWGFNSYHPGLNDNRGMSLVLPKTQKGLTLFHELKSSLFVLQIPYDEVEEETNHKPIIKSATPNPYREVFFKEYSSSNLLHNMEKYIHKGEVRKKTISRIKSTVRFFIGDRIVKIIKKRHD